jgi:hypothetical protein
LNERANKNDKEKPRVALIPPQSILEVAAVMTYGAKKYGDYNHKKGIVYSRLYSATQRHLLNFWEGKDIDESGYRALAHACAELMILMDTPPKWDDRYKENPGSLGVYYEYN